MNNTELNGSASRRLAEEIRAAARCGKFLEQMGMCISFRWAPGTGNVDIELRSAAGALLRALQPRELFEIFALDLTELEAWAGGMDAQRVGAVGA